MRTRARAARLADESREIASTGWQAGFQGVVLLNIDERRFRDSDVVVGCSLFEPSCRSGLGDVEKLSGLSGEPIEQLWQDVVLADVGKVEHVSGQFGTDATTGDSRIRSLSTGTIRRSCAALNSVDDDCPDASTTRA